MLSVGTKAPDFTLKDQNGVFHTLSSYKGKKILLYFYPKDNTPGCTKQACCYSENINVFSNNEYVVIGISKDSVESHKRFAEKNNLNFTLLSDDTLVTINNYDVWHEKNTCGKISMGVVRTTYVIDENGIIIFANDKVKAAEDAINMINSIGLEKPLPISILYDDGFENTISKDILYKIASTALAHEKAFNAEMSVFITGQEHILELNQAYLQADHDTDVLSFAMQEDIDDNGGFLVPDDGLRHIGEVIISYPQAEIQAKEHGHSALKETAILLVHGTLHLLGYDHDIEERKAIMWKHTDDIILELGDLLN